MKCEECGSSNLNIQDDNRDSATWCKYTDTLSFQKRAVCNECGFDNFIEENYKELSDGTKVRKL